jgi:hypothetical protein
MNRDDLTDLPKATDEDQRLVTKLGNVNEAIIVEEWTGAALEMEVRTHEGVGRMPGVVLNVVGIVPGVPPRRAATSFVIPLDIAKAIGPFITEHVGKIERNDRARLVDVKADKTPKT